MASFMEVLQTSRRSPNFSIPSPNWHQATFLCRAATKEIQRVIDTINDGKLYLRGPVRIGIRILCDCGNGTCKLADCAADHVE